MGFPRNHVLSAFYRVWRVEVCCRAQWAAQYKPDLEALGGYHQDTHNAWPHMLFRDICNSTR
jgi:hypothetical protein